MDNWEQYQTFYQAADSKIKDIIHSSLIPECVTDVVKKYELDDSHRSILIRIFMRNIVGMMSDSQTTVAIRTAGIPAALVISADINQCIQIKTATFADTSLVTETSEPIESSVKINTPETPSTKQNNLEDELAAAEAAFHDLQPIRTMAQDMETLKHDIEHLHTATSQDVLLSGDGNKKKNPDAAWDTE